MAMSKDVHVLVFDGFADWEPAHALAELRRWGKREILTIGFEARPVTSMGGLRVLPDRALAEVIPEELDLLILPGGDVWAAGNYPQAQLGELLHRLDASAIPIAAICGATIALARAGLLNDRRHTSTVPGDLNAAGPEYRGAAHYLPTLAVTDRGVITASGLGSVDFAREVFSALHVFSDGDLVAWFDMYKYGRLPSDVV
jgi:putative intracellular protease/amidase